MRKRFESDRPVRARLRSLSLLVVTLSGCGAVYPEISPPLKVPPKERSLSPSAPDDLLYLAFEGAVIPNQTRDGRRWDRVGGDAPDPFAQVFVDNEEIIKTPIEANTVSPTWPNQKRANYRIKRDATVRVELWDSNPINNRPICIKKLRSLMAEAKNGLLEVRCDSGARLVLRVEPAHARLGLGFYYELRTLGVYVSRVLLESPARRAGLRPGDELIEIMGRRVTRMQSGEAQSLINANAQTGVMIKVKDDAGRERIIELKEGPIYPVVCEGIPLA